MIFIKKKLTGAENVQRNFKISVFNDGSLALVPGEFLVHFLMSCLLECLII